jgi:hypothetical protein
MSSATLVAPEASMPAAARVVFPAVGAGLRSGASALISTLPLRASSGNRREPASRAKAITMRPLGALERARGQWRRDIAILLAARRTLRELY